MKNKIWRKFSNKFFEKNNNKSNIAHFSNFCSFMSYSNFAIQIPTLII